MACSGTALLNIWVYVCNNKLTEVRTCHSSHVYIHEFDNIVRHYLGHPTVYEEETRNMRHSSHLWLQIYCQISLYSVSRTQTTFVTLVATNLLSDLTLLSISNTDNIRPFILLTKNCQQSL
jgi:hypothetical protein